MPPLALALVLTAAVLHASWNLLLKGARSDAVSVSWLTATLATLVYTPLALLLQGDTLAHWSSGVWLAVLVSAVVHVAYFITLQRGYRAADLSVVYPVARGVGPLLTAFVAIAWLGEPAGPLSMAGIALVVCGTFTLAGGFALMRGGWTPRLRAGLGWGALTGVLIAAYTVNDGHAVRTLGAAPLLFYMLSDACRALILTPWAMRRAGAVRTALRQDWRAVVGVALLSPLAYVLVLQAMTMAPISHVAPAREVSMLIAAFLGARVLAEGELARRLAGAALIASGVACLALAG
jgi:drug/metabolite transporter (DMT)-like permease